MSFARLLILTCVIYSLVYGGSIHRYQKDNEDIPIDVSVTFGIDRNKRSASCCSNFMCACGKQEYCDRAEQSCKRCHQCDAGSRATSQCGDGKGQLAKCESCNPNEYSPGGLQTLCYNCTDCEGLKRSTLHPCIGSRDSLCGSCVSGYFDHSNLGPKVACTTDEQTTESSLSKLVTTKIPTNPSKSQDVTTVVQRESASTSAYTTPPNTTTYDTGQYSNNHTVEIPVDVLWVVIGAFILIVVMFITCCCYYKKKQRSSSRAYKDDSADQNCAELNVFRTQKEFEYNDDSTMRTSTYSSVPNGINQAQHISNEVASRRPQSLIILTDQEKKTMKTDLESGYTSMAIIEGYHSEEASSTGKLDAQPLPRDRNSSGASFVSEHPSINEEPTDAENLHIEDVNIPVTATSCDADADADIETDADPVHASAPAPAPVPVSTPTPVHLLPNTTNVYHITNIISAPSNFTIGQTDIGGNLINQAPGQPNEVVTPTDDASETNTAVYGLPVEEEAEPLLAQSEDLHVPVQEGL